MKTPVELSQKLLQYEDVDTAIAVYKEAHHIIGQYEEVKKAAMGLAENGLRETGEVNYKTVAGSCGWTAPKAKQLDKEAWQEAVRESSDLATVQLNYERAKATLEKAQTPFLKLPDERFFIR